jgi:hypothetical protein
LSAESTDLSTGLSQQQADELFLKYGPNQLPEAKLPGLSTVLELSPIRLHEWLILLGIALLLLLIEELHKAWLRSRARK